MREHLGYAFFKVVFRNCQHVVVEVWSCNSGLWTVNNMYLKVALLQNGCFIQVLVHYFFVLLVLYQKHFLLLLLAF